MTFKSFCYEMWLEYMEECLSYNQHAVPYRDWIKQSKWYLRKVYRVRYNTLQKPWSPNYEHILPQRESD